MAALTDLVGTLSIAEFVWLVFGVAALLFNSRALVFAVGDLRYLRQHWRETVRESDMSDKQIEEEYRIRETIANGQVYEEILGYVIDLIIIGIGSVAATIPSRPDVVFSWASLVTAGGLIAIALFNMVASAGRLQTRARLYDRVAARRHRTCRKGEAV